MKIRGWLSNASRFTFSLFLLFISSGAAAGPANPDSSTALAGAPADSTRQAIQWPREITVGPDKGVELEGTFFTTGDHIVFTYDQNDSTLLANGQPWHSWNIARARFDGPFSSHQAWARECVDRFRADHAAGTDSSRIRRAYESMDKTSIDTSFTRIEPYRLTVMFRGSARPMGILFMDTPESAEAQLPPEVQAAGMVRNLGYTLSNSSFAQFIMKWPFGEASVSGPEALECIALCQIATARELTSRELNKSKELRISGPIKRIRSMHGAGR